MSRPQVVNQREYDLALARIGDHARLLALGHNIIIIHAIPLIRLGLASAIIDTNAFENYSISAFSNLAEADVEISKAKIGDVIILDLIAWFSLTCPSNSTAFERVQSRGAMVDVIATKTQIKISRLATHDLLTVATLESELRDITAMVKGLIEKGRDMNDVYVPLRATRFSMLTHRQVHVLKLMSNGLTNRQIAIEVRVTEGNVKYHVTKIFKKLGCHLRSQAVMAFLKV